MKLFQLAALLFCIAPLLWAVDDTDREEPLDPISRHLQEMRNALLSGGKTTAGPVTFVAGNELDHSGAQFKSGSDWLSLSCTHTTCKLEAASLKVKPIQIQGHYDAEPRAGQLLTFKAQQIQKDTTMVAWFNTANSVPWLKPAAVLTYYAPGFPLKRPDSPCTLEAVITTPKGDSLLLIPMLLAAASIPGMDNNRDAVLLQLRASGKRQLLLGKLGECSGAIAPREYLRWSGDLDRDGKPDYLISYIDESGGPVHLYLSSYAEPGQLVGLAGVYISPESDTECD